MGRHDLICGLANVDPKPIQYHRSPAIPLATRHMRLKVLGSIVALLRRWIEEAKVSNSGTCSLPVRRRPSKHCATLEFSRRLRMVGRYQPANPPRTDCAHGRRVAPRSFSALGFLRVGLAAAFGGSLLVADAVVLQSAEVSTAVDLAGSGIGNPPADFEFRLTGQGEAGRWTVVPDPTAAARVAIEHVSRDLRDDRFPLAIYNPLLLKNVEITTRFKIVSGTMQTVGVAARLSDRRNYYAVGANALDSRVDLYRVVDGQMERIAGVDADVFRDHWQTLALLIDGDRFTVTLDSNPIFTAWDRTFRSEGRVALWTGGDNVTRFDQIEITPLPWSEQN
jgi:hypothetical protein